MSTPTSTGRRQVRRVGFRRDIVHKVKVTPEQEAKLVELAAQRGGITIVRLLVESALAGGAQAAAMNAQLAAELFGVVRMLGQVGNNVNQIARVANATGEVAPAAQHALEALARTCRRIDDVIGKVGQ